MVGDPRIAKLPVSTLASEDSYHWLPIAAEKRAGALVESGGIQKNDHDFVVEGSIISALIYFGGTGLAGSRDWASENKNKSRRRWNRDYPTIAARKRGREQEDYACRGFYVAEAALWLLLGNPPAWTATRNADNGNEEYDSRFQRFANPWLEELLWVEEGLPEGIKEANTRSRRKPPGRKFLRDANLSEQPHIKKLLKELKK